MTPLLVDTSVVVKWFHERGERDVTAARALLRAHQVGVIEAHILDLAIYELGNVLVRALGWAAADVAAQLDDLQIILGDPLTLEPVAWHAAASLAEEHSLSFYDAAWAAVAGHLGIVLVSADQQLVEAGLAEGPAMTAARLRLT